MLLFSVGVCSKGFEFQSRYIAFRYWTGGKSPLPFVMSCGGFFVCPKSKEEIISRTEVQGHRIFFSAGKDRYGRSQLHRKAALSHRVPEKSPDFLGKGGAVK